MCIRDRDGSDDEGRKTEWLAALEQGIHSREEFSALFDVDTLEAVSYTHLDVYKRQVWDVSRKDSGSASAQTYREHIRFRL